METALEIPEWDNQTSWLNSFGMLLAFSGASGIILPNNTSLSFLRSNLQISNRGIGRSFFEEQPTELPIKLDGLHFAKVEKT